jgi:hypothetical protein
MLVSGERTSSVVELVFWEGAEVSSVAAVEASSVAEA